MKVRAFMDCILNERRLSTFTVVLPAGETRKHEELPDRDILVNSELNAKANELLVPLRFGGTELWVKR